MVSRQIRVTGRVQGVNFREALRAEAERLGAAGWVRNRADGSVEALLQGEERIVKLLIDWARRGPPAARVEQLSEFAPPPELDRNYSRFERWPSL